ncbi:hypothetical protein M2651_14140 [Clostridium sp. SYSU_GA19001]|uniref:hypothetical protein n=1 Tax=Clostridium caldaquaticum TaxID=2940653 RepID=UPI0020776CE1|nr:hypothetical protein [Clostridium caldaquaticum]MCM8712136.1 hypothetical protein [Clostridium caldaquaticum]
MLYDNIADEALKKENFDKIKEYVESTFADADTYFNVFSLIEDKCLRFRFAKPKSIFEDKYPIYYVAGEGGYISYESKERISEILLELSGIKDEKDEITTIKISPMYLAIILACCDVAYQNKYEGAWFTVTSVYNAFDIYNDDNFERIFFPISYVARDVLYNSISLKDVKDVLDDMVKDGLLCVDYIDNVSLYSFDVDYRGLLNIFQDLKNRLAVLRYDKKGNICIIYVVTSRYNSWCFVIENESAFMEDADVKRFKDICMKVL